VDEMSEVRGETNESSEPGTGKPAQTPQSLGDSDSKTDDIRANRVDAKPSNTPSHKSGRTPQPQTPQDQPASRPNGQTYPNGKNRQASPYTDPAESSPERSNRCGRKGPAPAKYA
jgi:hypothetical protein